MTLAADEKLQLKVNSASGPSTVVIELSANGEQASFLNASAEQMKEKTNDLRDCNAAPSHFLYYYELFSGFSGARYDIYNKPNPLLPINHLQPVKGGPEDFIMRKATEDHQACGIVFLGVSTGPLP